MLKLITIIFLIFLTNLHLSAQDFDWETKFRNDSCYNISGSSLKYHNDKIMSVSTCHDEKTGLIYFAINSFTKNGAPEWYKIIKKDKPLWLPIFGKDKSDDITVYSITPSLWTDFESDFWHVQTNTVGPDGDDTYDYHDTTMLSDLYSGCLLPLNDKVAYFSFRKYQYMGYIDASILDKTGKFINSFTIDEFDRTSTGDFNTRNAIETDDGGVLVFGDLSKSGKNNGSLILKADKDFKKQWKQTYSDSIYFVMINHVTQTPAGYTVLATYISLKKNERIKKAIFIDDTGGVRKIKTLNSEIDYYYTDIIKDNNGDFIITGCKNCNYSTENISFVLEKRNADMDSIWIKVYGTDDSSKHLNAIISNGDGSYIITGNYASDLYLAKFTDKTLGAGDIAPTVNAGAILGNSPNPFEGETSINYTLPSAGNVRLSVIDVFGRTVSEVVNGYMDSGSHTARFLSGENPAGVYYLVLDANGRKTTSKMVIIK